MGTFDHVNAVAPLRIWDGATARAIRGERMTLAIVELDPGVTVPEHHHPNEQLGFVITGSLRFTIGGEERELGPGETYVIPGNVPHSAAAGDRGVVVCDVFSPIREDWERLERLSPTPGSWPD